MEKALSFFRVFDLAFFVPGAVLYWALHSFGPSWFAAMDPLATKLEIGTVQGIFGVVVAIGLVYFLGLLTHAVQRLIDLLIWVSRKETQANIADEPAWYTKLENSPRAELAFYFWYMRATCWNSAVAAALICWIGIATNNFWLLLSVLPGALLVFLGFDFHRALHSAVAKHPAQGPPTTGP